ncbi:MAG: hypothetical protein AUH30_20015 [Candidatus Rokubacteria bacterium 13_1_40CM_68_15]|nr:MAG: hypothetical protein AUH30_20015 [Candidatus Rokubacteria bacterium 13_1_40CM_68_15]
MGEAELVGFLSRRYGIPPVTLNGREISGDVLGLVPAAVAWKHEVLPLERTEQTLTLAMTDPTNILARDDISYMTGFDVCVVVAMRSELQHEIRRHYGGQGGVPTLGHFNTPKAAAPPTVASVSVADMMSAIGGELDDVQVLADEESNASVFELKESADPVEYNLKGVNQVQINEGVGRTFASALRAFLRQDPDVILVGEPRDLETAQISIRAALTGHLVFSTLHTNDSPSTIARLIDMGIPPFLVASSLVLVVAQRLGRKVCAACKEPYEADEESLAPYGHVLTGLGKTQFYKGRGCAACNFTGMKGRIALYEVMPVSQELRDMVLRSASTSELRQVAQSQGMKTLRQAGLLKVIEGVTTVEEVLRVTVAEW